MSLPLPVASELELVGAARQEMSVRLMDSLVHEARNPLNALAINLGVLAQKLRGPEGVVPPSQERNLNAMREQIARVDETLKLFLDFMGRKASSAGADFSQWVARAVAAVGHEQRRAQVSLESELSPDLHLGAVLDGGSLGFLALQPLLRGLARCTAGGTLRVDLSGRDGRMIYRVEDCGADDGREPFSYAVPALQRLALEVQGDVRIEGARLTLELPRAG